MSEPQIQIVTENDEPLKAADKKDAYTNGWFHRMARVMLEDADGRVLLQKRAEHMEMYPGRWDNSAAGYVDVGEDYITAALRELNEEIGIKDVKLRTLGYYESRSKFDWRLLNRFNRVYRLVVSPNIKFKLEAKEVAHVQWFTVAEARQLIVDHPDLVTDGLAEVMKRFYK
ncbi:MAG: NUDIX domain-containing protein [Patescibacteria group bacterium]|mgnify:CR=1 FL=1